MFKYKAMEFPEILRLELTNTCNMQCPHCRHHAPEKKKPENYPEYYKVTSHMTEEQVALILDEAKEYKPSVTLNVANEPTVAPTFKFACKKVKENGMSGTFNTNGLLLNDDLCKFLVDIEFDSVNISIDATTPETLKMARGITAIDRLIRNVERLLKIRGNKIYPRVGVTFVVMPYNEKEIDDFLSFWKERVDVIRFTGYITDGKPDSTVLPGVEPYKIPPRIPCKQIFKDIVIRANGDVTPCVITSESPDYTSMGNIFNDGGVKSVWEGKIFKQWREYHNEGCWNGISYCKGCDYWLDSFEIKEKEKDGFVIRSPSPYTVFFNVKEKMGNWDKTKLIERQGFGSKNKDSYIGSMSTYDLEKSQEVEH
jgi:radical SAM protein with 4Fe4S-binding SPASM domain